jgi:hypothetical protein
VEQFPELADRVGQMIWLHEEDNGFVSEVDEPVEIVDEDDPDGSEETLR